MNIPDILLFGKYINNIDLSYFKDYYSEDSYVYVDGEHYKLLTYLTNTLNGITIIDAGTHHGCSALALSQNPNNTVLSFDTQFMPIPFRGHFPNCVFSQQDVLCLEHHEILKAQLIILDIDPHDGIQEKKFFDLLSMYNYRGLVICDDIHIHERMESWWQSIGKYKTDLTEFGHRTGTGIVSFNPKNIRFVKE